MGFRFLCAATFVTSVVGGVAHAQRFDAQLKMQGLTLGKSTLDDVKVRIGDATVLKRGQGGDAVNSICYVPKAGDHTQLIFESGAAGGWSVLTGFRLSTDQVSGLRSNECAISTHLTSPLRLEGGLRLGLSQDEVVKLLGTPTRTRAGSVTYVSQATTQIRASTFDVQTIIRISFQQSKASSIAVLHTVTN